VEILRLDFSNSAPINKKKLSKILATKKITTGNHAPILRPRRQPGFQGGGAETNSSARREVLGLAFTRSRAHGKFANFLQLGLQAKRPKTG
jgi:hypothetical protein